MKVNIAPIRDLPGENLSFAGQPELKLADPNLGFHLTAPISVVGKITNLGAAFLIQADFKIGYQANCGRCLETFDYTLPLSIQEEFLLENTVADNENDQHIHFYGDEIDLKDWLTEHIWLALPMNFICQKNCRGLCPGCGKNLNLENCQCLKEEINPQFEKLRTLLTPEGGVVNGKSKK